MKSAITIRLLVVSIAVLASGAALTSPARATPPFLDPIANMTVTTGGCSGSTADQTISASDPDGDAITFISQGPVFMTLTSNPQVGNTRTGNIHVAPPPGTSGNFPASVTATANNESRTQTFTISVVIVNQPPVLNQPANMTVNEGATANQTITGSDPCGAPLTFSQVSGPTFMTVTTVNATTGNVNLAPGFSDEGTATAMVRATNPDGISDTKSFTITVMHADRSPVLSQPANMTVDEGATANQTLTATDPDGGALTFSKVSGPTYVTVTTTSPGAGTATGNLNLAPGFLDAGTSSATVRVTNGIGISDTKSFTITVNDVNRAPTLSQPANMTVAGGSTANQSLNANDADGNAITFSKVSGPTYVTVTTTSPGAGTATGNVNVAPGFADSGTGTVVVRVTDNGSPPLSNDKSFTVTVLCAGRPPVLNQPANMAVNEGSTANQPLTATDPDGNPLTFSKVSGPTYVTVTTTSPGAGTATGNVNVSPGFSDAGTAAASVRATDSGSCPGSDTKSFTITVNDVNRAPVLAQPANMMVTEGSTANQTLSATDPDGNPITFSKVSGPTYATITTTNPSTGNVNLAPGFSDAGTATVVARASDNGSPPLTNDKSFTVTVNNSCIGVRLNQPSNMAVNEASTADQTVTGVDGCDGLPLTFFKVSGPTFITVTTINATTGNIHVAPGFSDAGSYTVTIGASNGTLSDTKSFTVTVNNVNRPPTLGPIPSVTMNEGTVVNVTVTASDLDGDPLTFNLGACASFGVFDPVSRTIRLAPGFNDAGTYTCTISVSDGQASVSTSFTVTVLNVNRAPTLDPVADMTVAEGSTGDQAISGSDPDGDGLTFSKVAGPTFMTVTTTSLTTGNIHVAPGFSDAGVSSATVRASDGSLSADRGFSINVCDGCARPPVLAQPANMTVAEGATADQAVFASDPDGDAITLTANGPIFMTFTTFPSAGTATGHIHLAPGFADGGTYSATVVASDGVLTDSKSFTILVNSVCSGQPEANPGGPYQGFVNVPIEFDGSGSFDPSGAPLTFAWDFGDGATAAGVMPVHTYTALGIYSVVLTVTGECGASTGSTTAEIRPSCDALAFTRGGNRTIRLNSGRPTACAQIEPQGGCYRNEDVILSSVVMKYTGGAVTEIRAISDKTTVDSDTNGDGIAEITACFRKEDLRQLFSGLPGGESNPIVGLEGDLTTGGRFQTTLELRVISGGGTSAATVSPNPFNPAGTLTFTTARPGRAKVELFDVAGRLVRTILDEPSLGAGVHEVRIEGRGQRGESLASGIYFIRGVSAEGEFTTTIAILK
jgi:PKD repeat protein